MLYGKNLRFYYLQMFQKHNFVLNSTRHHLIVVWLLQRSCLALRTSGIIACSLLHNGRILHSEILISLQIQLSYQRAIFLYSFQTICSVWRILYLSVIGALQRTSISLGSFWLILALSRKYPNPQFCLLSMSPPFSFQLPSQLDLSLELQFSLPLHLSLSKYCQLIKFLYLHPFKSFLSLLYLPHFSCFLLHSDQWELTRRMTRSESGLICIRSIPNVLDLVYFLYSAIICWANMIIRPYPQAQITKLISANTRHVETPLISLNFLATTWAYSKQKFVLDKTVSCPIAVTSMIRPPTLFTILIGAQMALHYILLMIGGEQNSKIAATVWASGQAFPVSVPHKLSFFVSLDLLLRQKAEYFILQAYSCTTSRWATDTLKRFYLLFCMLNATIFTKSMITLAKSHQLFKDKILSAQEALTVKFTFAFQQIIFLILFFLLQLKKIGN